MFLLPLLLLRGRSWLDRFDIAVRALVRHLIRAVRYGPPRAARVGVLSPAPLPAGQDGDAGRAGQARPPAGSTAVYRPRCSRSACWPWSLRAIVLTLHPAGVIDVGTASALGAFKILHGQSIYYISLGHGDTYGPLAYLAYVPFEAIWPGSWTYLPAARAATITFDLLTIAGLILLGMRAARRPRRTPPRPAAGVAVGCLPVQPAGDGEEHQRRVGGADRRP